MMSISNIIYKDTHLLQEEEEVKKKKRWKFLLLHCFYTKLKLFIP